MNAPKDIAFQRVTPKRIIDDITNQIKEMIFSGSLKPNDRLPSEKELAASFGTGRMTVREALRMLEAVGFIYIKQGAEGGAFVKKLDATALTTSLQGLLQVGHVSLKDITEARINVEGLLLESAIQNADEEHMEILEKNIQRCRDWKKSSKEGNPPPFQLAEFHLLLAEPASNQLLKYFLFSLVELTSYYVHNNTPDLPMAPSHIKEHESILNSYKARKLTQTRKALKSHLISSARQIDEAVKATTKKSV